MSDARTPERIIDRLLLSGWRQFEDVEITFDPRLTILTGQNGAGKTTILNVLAPSVGWSVPMASVPNWMFRMIGSIGESLAGVWRHFRGDPSVTSSAETIGSISYSDGEEVEVQVPGIEGSTGGFDSFTVRYSPTATCPGLYIPSHRPLYLPTSVQKLSSRAWSRETAFRAYVDKIRPQWVGELPQYPKGLKGPEMASPLSVLKDVLCTLPRLADDDEDDFTIDAFEEKLRITLPPSLGFRSLRVARNEVGLVTESGSFALDAVSGGIAAVIDMTWQLFAYPSQSERFVALIDEPENHLHPEMQQAILPNMLEAFPRVQFIVSTHAPLVVTSVRDCKVYGLWYDREEPTEEGVFAVTPPGEPSKRIVCREIAGFAKAGTPDDTLRRVLGLDYTMPHWAAEQLTEEVKNIAREGVTAEELRGASERLHESGLGQYVGDALTMARERIQAARSAQYEESVSVRLAEAEVAEAAEPAEDWE